MKLTLMAMTIAVTMFASSASAFDPENLADLQATNLCQECDLHYAQLDGAHSIEANLKGADLSYVFITGVTFCNTKMPDGSVIHSGC